MLDLACLLQLEGIDPREVLVLRHRPTEPKLRKVFAWLAEEEPETFNWYQSSHGPNTESAVSRAKYVASFIGHEARRAVFVGLFAVAGGQLMARADHQNDRGYQRLMELGMTPWDEGDSREHALLFDLRLTEKLEDRKGRLIVDWPTPDRAWYRWGDPARNLFPVRAIHEESLLAPKMPEWHELVLSWSELRALPQSWRGPLGHWRGVYLIFDEADGKAYVGSAYGQENILGRWLAYSASGHGGNAMLRARDPRTFSFSILQRVSPDMPSDEVIAIETGWKARLHSRAPFGLNAN